jgi:hypothetical protein
MEDSPRTANPQRARVIKVAYFPKTYFLIVELGVSLSRVWRVIIDGKEVLQQRIIKRIGTGEETEF